MLRLTTPKRERSPLPLPFPGGGGGAGRSISARLRTLLETRGMRRALAAVLALGALLFLTRSWWPGKPARVPKWTRLRAHERALPQHDLALPEPEGARGRYVRFSNQIRGLGWNNVLNEMCVVWRIVRAGA
jgi:hypothetical protein